MITKIIEQLKTGQIKNVVPFGVEQLPAPPYIVVKTERDPLDRGKFLQRYKLAKSILYFNIF